MSNVIEAAAAPGGKRIVLAHIRDDRLGYAQCAADHCSVEIQRMPQGDLYDGVRAHYKTVHPERNIQ